MAIRRGTGDLMKTLPVDHEVMHTLSFPDVLGRPISASAALQGNELSGGLKESSDGNQVPFTFSLDSKLNNWAFPSPYWYIEADTRTNRALGVPANLLHESGVNG
jgi:hypothetical protein